MGVVLGVLQLARGHRHAGVREGEREATGDSPLPSGGGRSGLWDHTPRSRGQGHAEMW